MRTRHHFVDDRDRGYESTSIVLGYSPSNATTPPGCPFLASSSKGCNAFVHSCFVKPEWQDREARAQITIPASITTTPDYLCSPYISPHTLNPVSQLIDSTIPFPQANSHSINLLHIQHLRLHPIDACDLSNLIDAAP
jgi:hypothetical protein